MDQPRRAVDRRFVSVLKQDLDFIVIGAQKSGTTSLFEYLRRHPQLCLPSAKEVPYFSHDARYRDGWSDYLRKAFPFADPSQRWGTVTPQYMVGGLYDAARDSPGSDVRTVPERIRRQLPEVRLIAILRDPIERARSHHAMALMNGWDSRSFDEAIHELLSDDALQAARRLPDERTGYVVWGEYGRILEGYLDVFPREQLLVLFMADLKDRPHLVLQRVLEFLGVDATFVPDNLGTTYRPGSSARRLRWLDLKRVQAAAAENQRLRRLWHAIPEATRRRIDRQFDRTNYRMDLWNRRSDAAGSSSLLDVTSALRTHYDEDADRLRAIVGAAPPWSTAPALS